MARLPKWARPEALARQAAVEEEAQAKSRARLAAFARDLIAQVERLPVESYAHAGAILSAWKDVGIDATFLELALAPFEGLLDVPEWRAFVSNTDAVVRHFKNDPDAMQRKELKLYIAYTRLKNFATVVPQKARLLLYLHLDVDLIAPPPGIGRDVRQQGHWGTGDMELSLATATDLDLVKPLIQQAYEGRAAASVPSAEP